MATTTPHRTDHHPAQYAALLVGAVYTLVGIAGFFVTGLSNFASETDKTLLGFEVNPLHNIVHLLIGVAGLAAWRTIAGTRGYGIMLAVGYGLAFLYGLFAVGNPDLNFLSLNVADNFLHLASAIAGAVIAFAVSAGSGRTAGHTTA